MGKSPSALLSVVDTDHTAGEMGANIDIRFQGPGEGCGSQASNEKKWELHHIAEYTVK